MNTATLTIIIAVVIVATAAYLLATKKKGTVKSPGSFRKPTEKNSVINQITTILLDDFELESAEFRKVLGYLYPDFKMALRQSIQLGLARYANHHWSTTELTEEIIPKLVHQIVVDYYGFTVPRNFNGEQFTEIFNKTFKTKVKPYRSQLVWPEGNRAFQFLEKETLLAERKSLPDSRDSLLLDIEAVINQGLLKDNLEMVNCTNPESLHLQFAFLPVGLKKKITEKYGKEKTKAFFQGLTLEAQPVTTSETSV